MTLPYTAQDFDNDLRIVLENLKGFIKTGVNRAPTAAHARIVSDNRSDMAVVFMPDFSGDDEMDKKMITTIGYVTIEEARKDSDLISPEVKSVFIVAEAWHHNMNTHETQECVVITGYMPDDDLTNFAQVTVERDNSDQYMITDEEVRESHDKGMTTRSNAARTFIEGTKLSSDPDWLVDGRSKHTSNYYDKTTYDITSEKITIDQARLN